MPNLTEGYNATRTPNSLTVHRVPIFCDCERWGIQFTEQWVRQATAFAFQQLKDGYKPPLHKRHHEPGTDVEAAGVFEVLGVEPISMKGVTRSAMLADLIITDPSTQEEVLAMRLPYLSVEIADPEDPKIASVALLDHEAPFIEFPLIAVNELDESAVPKGPISNPRLGKPSQETIPVVTCLLQAEKPQKWFSAESAMTDTATPVEEVEEKKQTALFQDDDSGDKKKDDGDADMQAEEGGGVDVASVIKMIESGEIMQKDFDLIKAAMAAALGGGEEPEVDTNAPAEVQAPGAAMKADSDSAKFAAVTGRLMAMEAKDKARDEAELHKDDVSEAFDRLKDRPMGAKLKERLDGHRKEMGSANFKIMVDEMAKTFGELPSNGQPGFIGKGTDVPEIAMKHQSLGPDAVAHAASLVLNHAALKSAGSTVPVDRYVENKMAEWQKTRS